MQKNDKSYTFLLSHKSKNKIYIRRIEVSKSVLHFGSVGLFLIIGITTLGVGIGGIVKNAAFTDRATTISSVSSVQTQLSALPARQIESIDYQRPAESNDVAFHSGGPEEDDLANGEDSQIDGEILTIRKSANPAYLPTMWAHLGKINNEFGFRRNPFGGRTYEFHPGMDIDGERGDMVVAPANGTVVKAAFTGGYGNMIEIDHGNGLTSRYGHLSKIESVVGDTVTRGQLIGYVGSTGRSTGPHLHYELRLNDRPINPRHFLPQEPAELASIAK
jgi:murein DD-endopeptidase MepM/ murein hydrolase activator NlpD